MNNKIKLFFLPCLLGLALSTQAEQPSYDQKEYDQEEVDENNQDNQLYLEDGAATYAFWDKISAFFSSKKKIETCDDYKRSFSDIFKDTKDYDAKLKQWDLFRQNNIDYKDKRLKQLWLASSKRTLIANNKALLDRIDACRAYDAAQGIPKPFSPTPVVTPGPKPPPGPPPAGALRPNAKPLPPKPSDDPEAPAPKILPGVTTQPASLLEAIRAGKKLNPVEDVNNP